MQDSALLYALFIGIISGLLATFLTVGIRSIWLQIIMPWYENVLYQGPKIEGHWETEFKFSSDEIYNYIITLKRVGYSITGIMVCTSGANTVGTTYEISGKFKNLILSGTCEPTKKRSFDRAAFTLMLINNGTLLRGYFAYYDNDENSILSIETEWKPKV